MSWHQHNGWPIEAIHLLTEAEELRKRIHAATRAPTENQKILDLEAKREELMEVVSKLDGVLSDLRQEEQDQRRENLVHLRKKEETLIEKALALKRGVPEIITDFIRRLNEGVDWSAAFQILWWNETHVILRLAGRKFWNGRGSQGYAQAETRMYDLRKFKDQKHQPRGGFGGLSLDRECRIKSARGRVSAKLMKEWKEEADYVAA